MMLPTTLCREFLHLVIPHCSACPDPVATYMIRRAAISWAETTKGWRYTGSQVMAANGETLVAPDHTEIHTIEEATIDGAPLTPVLFLDSEPEQLTGTVLTGAPRLITQVSPGSVQIQPFRTGTLRFSVTLKPRSDRLLGTFVNDPLRDQHDVVPPFLLTQHADTIAFGALTMILMLPNQPFSDPTKAMVYRQEFLNLCNSAHVQARPGQQRAPRRTTTHWI